MDERYSIEQADGITTIRLRRRLDLEEMLELIDEVAVADDCPRRLWEVTGNFQFRPDEIQAIAARGRLHWPGAARVAYLAADDLAFGLLRMFEVYREQENYETRVFRDEVEARRWLAGWSAPQTDLTAPAPAHGAAGGAASAERLVADSQANWWKSPTGIEERRRIETEVRSRYEADLELAGWFKEAWLELRIRREIAAECARVLWASDDGPKDDPSAR